MGSKPSSNRPYGGWSDSSQHSGWKAAANEVGREHFFEFSLAKALEQAVHKLFFGYVAICVGIAVCHTRSGARRAQVSAKLSEIELAFTGTCSEEGDEGGDEGSEQC